MQNFPTKLYQAQQVRELDRIAISQYGIAGIVLMQKAAAAVWAEIQQRWATIKSICVFCGAGNNAGDGYLIATLALQAGLDVCVYSLIDIEKLNGDAATACQIYQQAGGKITQFSAAIPLTSPLIVDALLGTGLAREVHGAYAQAVQIINDCKCSVISVDIPSGLNADTGKIMACAVKADVTVTFIALKQGLFTADDAEYCGEIVFADLDIPQEVFQTVSHSAELVEKPLLPRRNRNSHKGSYGHVLVIGGEIGFSGAARLGAEAALRTGAGLVSVATRAAHANVLNVGRFELMCHPVEKVSELQPLLAKASVIAIGMGLGQQAWGRALFAAAISQPQPMIIDADALNLLAQTPRYQTHWILTPHPGEAARLLNCSTVDIQQDRFASVSALQNKYKGIVILKGSGTLIASENESAVSTTGNPGMASGGMGDVLTGIIAGFVAQGLTLKEAAQQGVYGHGQAADLAAKKGERGLLASDLMSYLRQVVN